MCRGLLRLFPVRLPSSLMLVERMHAHRPRPLPVGRRRPTVRRGGFPARVAGDPEPPVRSRGRLPASARADAEDRPLPARKRPAGLDRACAASCADAQMVDGLAQSAGGGVAKQQPRQRAHGADANEADDHSLNGLAVSCCSITALLRVEFFQFTAQRSRISLQRACAPSCNHRIFAGAGNCRVASI